MFDNTEEPETKLDYDVHEDLGEANKWPVLYTVIGLVLVCLPVWVAFGYITGVI